MDTAALLARMAAQRESWVDLPGGLRLQVRRPPEVELPRLIGGVTLEHVVAYACGWDKFTEATLLGAAVGASDAVPFDQALWKAYAEDHVDVVQTVAQHLARTAGDYLERKAAEAKNSAPSSS